MNDETKQSHPPAAPAAPAADTVASAPAPPGETVAPGTDDDAAAPARAASRTLAVPGYEVLGELGRGGMGVVYKARQLKLNRVVALKMVLGAQHANPRELIRFLSEAEAVAAIKHPHVIQVYDSGEADGRPFMAMECLEGGSLVTRLRERGKLPARAAAELVLKVARGVQAAHERGIVHRDLKPHNVLLDAPPAGAPPGAWGEPKVTDFGLAKRGASDLTQTGAIMGTPAYMAPEQAMGQTRSIGPPADVYALGVILYECLSGTVPFTGDDAWSVIRRVVGEEPEPVARRAGGVPRDLSLICRKCLEKNPADRYPTAKELADDLQRFLGGAAILGPRTGALDAARRFARRWWRPLAVASAAAAVILAAWLLPSPFDRGRPRKDGPAAGGPKEEPRFVGPERPAEEEAPLVKLRREEVNRRVEALRQTKANPDRECPHPLARLPELPPASFDGFKVLGDERVVDMRGWRPNPGRDPSAPCSVVYHDKRELVKVAPADRLRVETRTTGRELVMRGLRPDPAKVKALAAERPGAVGRQPMKRRQLVFDTSAIPIGSEFTVQFTSTYHDSLQTPEEQWFGVIGYEGSFKVSMLMLFPADRPFRGYELRVAAVRADDPKERLPPEPYTGPVITFCAPDKSWLYWEIPGPKANYVYRVDWTW